MVRLVAAVRIVAAVRTVAAVRSVVALAGTYLPYPFRGLESQYETLFLPETYLYGMLSFLSLKRGHRCSATGRELYLPGTVCMNVF